MTTSIESLDSSNSCRVLLVDDDFDFHGIIQEILPKEFSLHSASTLSEADALLGRHQFDLILLDLTLPDGEGLHFCSKIRENAALKDIPLILLTGRSEVEDKVDGFQRGADDYLVKPFDLREFKARVFSKLKRAKEKAEQESGTLIGNLKLDIAMQKVALLNGAVAEAIEVTPLEFKLLLILSKGTDRAFSRDELIRQAWGAGVHVLNRTVDSHLSDLRKKISGSTHTIKCIRGVGYQMVRRIQA